MTALEWTGVCFQAAGALWLALHLHSSGYAYVPMLAGALMLVVLFWRERRWPLAGLNATFAVINVVGIWRWL